MARIDNLQGAGKHSERSKAGRNSFAAFRQAGFTI